MISILNSKKTTFKGSFQKILAKILPAFFILGFASCESIYDKEVDCDPYYYIKFVYDMNMDYANAFHTKVNSVELFVFSKDTGELVWQNSESGEVFAQEGYRMRVYIQPGDYDFVAWCGLENNEDHFTIPADIAKKEDLSCTMAREYDDDGTPFQNKNLYSLFHGRLEATLEDLPGDHVYEMPLIKDTNNINFSLQEVNGNPIDPADYEIKMTAKNGAMAFDNSLSDDQDILFKPYRQVSGAAFMQGRADDDASDGKNVVLAEIATSRLIANHNPMIEVRDVKNNWTIYSVPLVKWALMLKSEQYSRMGNQEYLDREDEFNVVLYFNSQKYLAISVMINGWHMVINDDTVLGQ